MCLLAKILVNHYFIKMDLEKLKKQLIIDEGYKLEVYLDHLGYPTVGIGHLLTKKDPELLQWELGRKNTPNFSMKITENRCQELFLADIANVVKDCRKLFTNFDYYAEEIKQIIANMMFNLGLTRFSKFLKFIAAIQSLNYKQAAKQMAHTIWAKQVPNRAKPLIDRMNKYADDLLCKFN